ncbi:MAG TPA: hypothetical protein DEP84_36870 [Chloroflexi bacterium]|nr:hypothetical protein [Chloroflexota bacterium]
MRRHNPIDVRQRAAGWRERGWTGFDQEAEPYTGGIDEDRGFEEGQTTVPVVEEQMQVGKREVESGGVRVHRYVTEKPVEERVRRRDEDVDVSRRRVDRPASEADLADAFQEETIEVSETHEEPVVAKKGRVTEEVIIDKDVSERTQTVCDTVRDTEVEVEPLGSQQMQGARAFETLEPDFRRHYQTNFANTGYTYDQVEPAYRYGYVLARNENYRDRDWSEIEPEARQRWEARNPGTWQQVKNAVRDAWQQVKNAV